MSRSTTNSKYLHFTRLHSAARFSIGGSGVLPCKLADLGAPPGELEINSGSSAYGHKPLLERIAAHCGVDPDCVVTSNGCSMGNHLVYAGLFEPGDEVLIEQPAYEPMLAAAEFLGAKITRFQRPFENQFAIDLRDVERRLTQRTRLIVLCNLHNPSSALTDSDVLRAIGDLARSVGARVLVDEVYLEAIVPRPRTAFSLGTEFVVTSSLTKAYGLGGLRCGWILAEPQLARRMWGLNDLFGVHQPHPAQLLSVLAFDQMDRIAQRAQNLLTANRALLREFLKCRADLECFVPEHGTTAFPRLKRGTGDQLFELLQSKYETSIISGSFFEAPQHFRIGLGEDTEVLREGLRRLDVALGDL
ncbi:MAG: pyridoxal phosphate-dependent aminotransferase [Terriglobales bacterium]